MNQEQVSSAVYGLFLEDTDQDVLLGLYNLEGEAEAARQHYIAVEVADYNEANQEWAREDCERNTYVQRLAVGQLPSYRFACR